MKRSVTFRTLAVYLPIDLFFALCLAFAHWGLFDAEVTGGYIGAFAALSLSRFGIWALFAARHLAPVAQWNRRGPQLSDAEVRTADRAVATGPIRLASLYAFVWTIKLLLVTAYLAWWYGRPETISPFGLQGSLLLAAAVGAGASVFSYPLLQVLTASEAEELSVEAQARGLGLERPASSLQNRIALLAVGLAAAPTVFVASLGYALVGIGGLDVAEQEAAVAVREAAMRIPADAAIGAAQLDELAEGLGGDRVHLAVLDTRGGTSAGDLLEDPEVRDWLEARIHNASAGAAQLRRSSRGLAFRSLGNGRLAVASVRASDESARTFLYAALAFFVTIMVWGPLSAVLFSRSVVRPLETVTGAVRDLVERGRLDDIGTVPIVQRDEVGQLGHDFNALLRVLGALSRAAGEIADGKLDVDVKGEGDLPDAFRGMLASLRSVVGQMNETSVQLASAAAEIFAATQEQEMAATTQSSSMREISQTMESLSESAAHVSESVEGVLQNAERTLETTDQMVERIGELSAHANRIGEILEAIREIADRSDLLALNGSLEASHAGDAGRGFALVAAEMRRLAERVTSSVADVKNLVDDIRQSGSSTVMATEESKKLADATTEAARSITLVTQQQRSSTEQVSESVRELTEVVSQTVAATSQTRASAETLKEQADHLSGLVRKFRIDSEAAA